MRKYRDGVNDGFLAAVGIVLGAAVTLIGIEAIANSLEVIFGDDD